VLKYQYITIRKNSEVSVGDSSEVGIEQLSLLGITLRLGGHYGYA
jgi:hypothetical protein